MLNSTSTWMVSGLKAAPIPQRPFEGVSSDRHIEDDGIDPARPGPGRSIRRRSQSISGDSPTLTTRLSRCTRGMSVREIHGHLEELYIDVSGGPDLGGRRCGPGGDAEWQNWPLDVCYPLVFFDAIRVKIR
jgi:hypothetical protein